MTLFKWRELAKNLKKPEAEQFFQGTSLREIYELLLDLSERLENLEEKVEEDEDIYE